MPYHFPGLSKEQKAAILDAFTGDLQEMNRSGATIMGTIQILETLDHIAVDLGFVACPRCGHKGKKEVD